MGFRGIGQGLELLGGLCRSLLRRPGLASGAVLSQSGAIPYRHVDGEVVFLIITSRATGTWIFPKGGLMDGLSPTESAAQEAYEEAGVRGDIETTPAGSYHTVKTRFGIELLASVQMYPLEVVEQLDDWPEKGDRQRCWVTLDEARRRISDPALVTLAETVAGNVSD